MQLSPKQVCFVTLGSLASLSTYGLMLTQTGDPEATASNPPAPNQESPSQKPTDQNLRQPDLKTSAKAHLPLAHPEAFTPEFLSKTVAINQAPQAIKPDLTPTSRSAPVATQPIQSGIPHTSARLSTPRKTIKIDNLAVNQLVAESLAPDPVKPTKSTLTAEAKIPGMTQLQSTAAIAEQQSPLKPAPTLLSSAADVAMQHASIQPETNLPPLENRTEVIPATDSSSPATDSASFQQTSLATAAIAKPERFLMASATKELQPKMAETSLNTSLDSTIYALKPGDLIQIQLSKQPEQNQEYQVLENGSLNLSEVGQIEVRGRTLKQVEALIATKYQQLGTQTQVNIVLLAIAPDPSDQSLKLSSEKLVEASLEYIPK